jgi:hypothetical protein
MKRKTRDGELAKCTICRMCDFKEIGVQVIDPYVIVWWDCQNCDSRWSEEFKAVGHKLETNGKTGI